MKWLRPAIVLLLLAAVAWLQRAPTPDGAPPGAGAPPRSAPATTLPDWLPAEAQATVRLIARGGPFPYRQDGSVFGNHEGRLPKRPRGYYHEYTVPTPGAGDRGARRIVTGGEPALEYHYSADHYRSFRRFEVRP
jgi:guanyl-specific ribonuclease Sa